MGKSILHIGAGKLDVSIFETSDDYHVYVDTMYRSGFSMAELEERHNLWNRNNRLYSEGSFSNYDVFNFLDHYALRFDHIVAERIFEHMFYDSGEIGRLLDACYQSTNDDGSMEILVPNIDILISEYGKLDESKNMSEVILRINTEFHNSRSDAHGSSWSPKLARYYIESEGTWKIDSIEERVEHRGRDVYMRVNVSKRRKDGSDSK